MAGFVFYYIHHSQLLVLRGHREVVKKQMAKCYWCKILKSKGKPPCKQHRIGKSYEARNQSKGSGVLSKIKSDKRYRDEERRAKANDNK